jgi:hypothetical protein
MTSSKSSSLTWAVRGDLDLAWHTSNTFEIEWPHKSGQPRGFPCSTASNGTRETWQWNDWRPGTARQLTRSKPSDALTQRENLRD